MPPISESEFRSVLAACPASTFAAFVADLWRARGHEVRREGDRLVVDGRQLRPVTAVGGGRSTPADAVLVAATTPPADAGESVVGPGELYRILLYDVPRERAAELFESHFDRSLAVERTGGTAESTGRATADPGPSPGEDATPSRRGTLRGRLVRTAGRLARSPRTLLGDRRVQVVAVATFLVLVASLWGLFLYQPAPETASEPPFALTESPAPVDGNYRALGRVYVDGDGDSLYYDASYTYAPGDPAVGVRRLRLGGSGGGLTSVTYRRGDVSYARNTWTDVSDYRDGLERYDHADVVYASEGTRTIYRVHRRRGQVSAAPVGGFPPPPLARLPYERQGTATYEGRTVERYVPTPGWTTRPAAPRGETRTFRVRAASGEVLVDPETGAVLSADVEATVVAAETWADALTGPAQDFRVSYRVEEAVERPRTPPWVEWLDANATATNAG